MVTAPTNGAAGVVPAVLRYHEEFCSTPGRSIEHNAETYLLTAAAIGQIIKRNASISVKDSGIGIAAENHERVFEDFRQVDDSPSRQYGGTGLGLAICRRLATMLGGRISLNSNLGEGSTFTLIFPVDADA